MHFPFFVARRYLFAKKSHHAINIISGIAVVGVAVTTMALVCTLSVFNGFRGLVASLFTHFDPELKVTPRNGGFVSLADKDVQRLMHSPDVAVCTPVAEGQALVVMEDKQVPVQLKGVADNFMNQTGLKDILYGDGQPTLHADVLQYCIPGIQLCASLGLGVDFVDPLQVYAPKSGERVNMANPMSSFNHDELQSSGLVFNVHQNKYDQNYIICSLAFVQGLLDHQGEITALEIKPKAGVSKSDIETVIGRRFIVQNRYEQQQDVFRIMQVEKLISYAFLCFILIVSCLNIIGSLSMLMIEKKNDAETLRSMGATSGQIRSIFMNEGRIIVMCGAVTGVLLGTGLCLAQQQLGLIKMGKAEGSFIVDAYPVIVDPVDVVAIFLTVIIVGFLSVRIATRKP